MLIFEIIEIIFLGGGEDRGIVIFLGWRAMVIFF